MEEKVALLDRFNAMAKTSQREAAIALEISRGQLQNLIKNEGTIRAEVQELGGVKRKRVGKDEEVEKALLEWWEFSNRRNMPVNGPILCQKAEVLAQKAGHHDFRATDGWFSRWKKRNGIVFTVLKGEAAEADVAAANEFRRNQLGEILQSFDKRDILNADETGIYFRALPDSTYIAKKDKKGKKGFKTAKDRVTLMVCCNMDGGKEDLLLIGKPKKPRCFKNLQQLPLTYDFSSNAWMTSRIWERWLRVLDLKFHRQKRKVLMLVDNCSAHTQVDGLKSITVKFLPPNTTSVLQPCDMGIIRTLKAYFRHQLRQNIIDTIDDSQEELVANEVVKKVTLLDTMNMLDVAWEKVTAETIRNCWRKGGFVGEPDPMPEMEPLPSPPPGLTAEVFDQWITIDDDIETTGEITEEEMTDQLVGQILEATEPIAEEVEEESDDEPEPMPTAAEMRTALAKLDRGLQLSGFAHPDFRHVTDSIKEHLRKTFPPKQATLERFFCV